MNPYLVIKINTGVNTER